MKRKTAANCVFGLMGLTILALGVEILMRRWIWRQLPTQVSASWIYLMLAFDLVVVGWVIADLRVVGRK